MSFELDISKYIAKTKSNLETGVRNTIFQIATKLDERSPVDSGHYRLNNQYGFGTPPSNIIEGVDPTGIEALTIIQEKMNASPPFGVHYLANNVPYAQRIEEGWSGKAPLGVYELTSVEMESIMKEEMAK